MRSLSIFRSAFNTVKKRYSFLTLTALLMAAGVFVYYFYFLTARSDALDQRQLRALSRIESTLRLNVIGYKGLAIAQANTAVKDAIKALQKDSSLPNPVTYRALVRYIEIQPDGFENALYNVSFIKTSPKGGLRLRNAYATSDIGTQLNEAEAFVDHDLYDDSLVTITVYTPLVVEGVSENGIAAMDFSISVGSLLRPLLRNDLFDQYFVVKDSAIVYSTVSSPISRLDFDTTVEENKSAYGTKRIVINGVSYRAYSVGLSLHSEPGWSIVGLVSEDSFATEKRTVPRPYLFIVFLFIVFLILSIPFIKSLIMSRTERLGTLDVIFSSISLVLTTSILSILMMDGFMRLDLDEHANENQLLSLSDRVEHNVHSETKKVVTELQAYAAYFEKNIGLIPDTNESVRRNVIDSLVDSYHPVAYPEIRNMFFVDSSGFTNYDYRDPGFRFNVSLRHYVSEVRKGNCIRVDSISSPFYLDAIISWREQKFRAAVSIPTPPALNLVHRFPVMAMTLRMKALSAPVLPVGSGFSIFDSEGNVIFHSDSVRSLNENIVEECDNDAQLRAAIEGRTTRFLDVNYSGTPVSMYVRPLTNMPYFIATFSGNAPTEAMHGQVFGLSFILEILLVVWFMGVILFGVIIMRRKTRLNIPLFSLTGVVPQESGRDLYLKAILFNILHGTLLFATSLLLDEPLTVIVLFFISSPYTVILNMTLLSGKSLKAFATGERSRVFRWCLILVFLANCVSVYFIDSFLILISIQLLFALIYYLLDSYSGPEYRTDRINSWLDRIKHKTAYTWLVFTLVILISVIPAMRFSIIAYDKEKEIEVKTAQLNIYHTVSAGDQRNLSHYYSAFYSTAISPSSRSSNPPSKSDSYFDAFSSVIRGNIQNYGEEYNRLRFGAADGKWTWVYESPDSLIMVVGNAASGDDQKYQLGSRVALFSVPFFGGNTCSQTLRFWFCTLLAFILLYHVLRFFVSKIFAHEKYSRVRSLRFDQAFFESTEPGYKAFVTGMPSAGKSAYFRKLCEDKPNVIIIDFVAQSQVQREELIQKAAKPGKGIVVLDHFEHDILNFDITLEKLDIVERLISNKEKKVVIISSVQSAVFLNMLESEEEDPEMKEKYRQLCERWNRALAAFYDFVYPLQGYDRTQNPIITEFSRRLEAQEEPEVPSDLLKLIESECDHGVFMQSIGVELLSELHGRSEIHTDMKAGERWKEREDLIIRTQKLADNYYRSIWTNLTVEEQFVLFDLAQDGLVNAKNLDIVELLIDKGLVVYRQQLEIMNQSFRNYVLCIAGPSDVSKLEEKMKDAGAWNKLKAPLFLIVFSLLLFVVKSDRSSLFGYFTAFTAIIPIAVTVFGYFGKSAKKE